MPAFSSAAGRGWAALYPNINKQITGQDGKYAFLAEIPMLEHRFFGAKVCGDIDIVTH